MDRYVAEVNAGGIIRPNGDFRLDCMAPFIIGNVLKTPLKELWQTKGDSCMAVSESPGIYTVNSI